MGSGQLRYYRHRRMRRPASDLVLVGVGMLGLAASWLAASQPSVSDLESAAFALANDSGEIPQVLAWLPMQFGNVVAVPLSALVALVRSRFRLAVELAGAGMLVWVVAKGVKDAVERGRPGALVEEAILRDAHPGGLGFPSGHAAVATALAAVAWPHLGRLARAAVVTVATLVGVLRIYVGAHLPLDITGGAGLGLAGAGAVRLASHLGSRRPRDGGGREARDR